MDHELEKMLGRIRERFTQELPNGWLLNWDVERLLSNFKKAVGDLGDVENATSFDYMFCNQYEVKLVVNEAVLYMVVGVSFIEDVYQLHWMTYDKRMHPKYYDVSKDTRCMEVESNVRAMLKGKKFYELPKSWGAVQVGVRLELAEEFATVDNCLFEDNYHE